MNDLTARETLRYSRHLVMPEVGLEGQAKLKAARVLCVGVGGLGSPAALYLAAAGVGTLGLVDDDVVDLSNIQRQILYSSDDVGRPKVQVAAERLQALNPDITVVGHAERIDADNALALLADYDVVIDGSDNFPTRYLVNDAGVLAGKPVIYGSVLRFDGQLSVFDARSGPCYRCVFPEPPAPGSVPSCAEGGVLGVLPGIIGSLQALEAIKLVLGVGSAMQGRLLLFDGTGLSFREIAIAKGASCPVCGEAPSITDLAQAHGQAAPSVPVPDPAALISPSALAQALGAAAQPPGPGPVPALQVVDVRTPAEREIVRFPGALEVPLDELAGRLDELPPGGAYVITCHKGPRAVRAWQLLRDAGYGDVRVLEGGLDAWAEQLDPDMPRYG